MGVPVVFDGGYYLHKSFSIAGKHRDPKELEKNTLTIFLQSVCSTALSLHGTHVLVCLDASRSFRYEISKDYKANRHTEGKSETVIVQKDGSEFRTKLTPGALVKPAKKVLELAGLTYSHKKGYEADDLMNCAARSFSPQHYTKICTRDKDIAACVNDRVVLYWPREKRIIDKKAVIANWGVKPSQMRDYLCLVGDDVDNIPGCGFGPVTAAKFLNQYGSIKRALENDEGRAKLKPQFKNLQMAKKLVTLKNDVHYNIDDCVVQDFSNELTDYVWSIPSSLKNLGDIRKAAGIKGLFGRR